jgi:hypothetical protein
MSTQTVIEVLIYKREDCCLCEEMLAVVEGLRSEFPLDIRCIDIGADADLEAQFGTEIPVLFVAGRKAFKFRVSAAQLRRYLCRAHEATG